MMLFWFKLRSLANLDEVAEMSKWYKLLRPALKHFRTRRALRIREHFPEISSMNVLDLGGSVHFWEEVGGILKPMSVLIMNIAANGQSASGSGDARDFAHVVLYDGKHIPLENQSIDLLICNSVLEHVPPRDRAGLVAEIKRVAKRYVVQTPASEFPLELHLLMPILHWLPRSFARKLVPFSPMALLNGRQASYRMFDEVYLLSKKDVRQLFPTQQVFCERFLGLAKSYLVFN